MSETDEKVDRLLHDAEHADSGVVFARTMGHTTKARELCEKRDRLILEALALDPDRTSYAWTETSLSDTTIGSAHA